MIEIESTVEALVIAQAFDARADAFVELARLAESPTEAAVVLRHANRWRDRAAEVRACCTP